MSRKSPTKAASEYAEVSFQEISADHAGQRLDNYLLARLKGVPKSRIYRIIRKGEVRVNKKREKPEYKLQTGDLVRVPPVCLAGRNKQVPPTPALQALLREAILFEDDYLLIINKPAGLSVHRGTGVQTGLIESLRHMFPELPALELVHRLDKGTSGCLLLAKQNRTLKALSAQFKENKVSKTYHAIVEGHWPDLSEVSAALDKGPAHGGERFVKVSNRGKSALTRFNVLEALAGATLVQANPVTGRTHQIRVHAQLAGCPVVGDEKYSTSKSRQHFAKVGIQRLCLHAAELALDHPGTGKRLVRQAPHDSAFEAALRCLRSTSD